MVTEDNVRKALTQLRRVLGEAKVLSSFEDTYLYSFDAMSPYRGFPDAVVRAYSTEDVVCTLKIADEYGVPVIPRGGGSSLTGAVVPLTHGLILDLKPMRRVEVRVNDGVVEAEAGATISEVDNECRRYGFFFPPDPASAKVATVGGAVANNSGGMRGARYGTIKDWVLQVEVVLPGGTVARFGEPVYKQRVGYDLAGLFVGSEGTLGVITKAVLKLAPLPEKVVRLLALFNDVEEAGKAVAEVRRQRFSPFILELLDDETIKAVNEVYNLNLPVAQAIVIADVDGPGEAVERVGRNMADIFLKNGATDVKMSSDPAEMERLYAARQGAFGAASRIYPSVLVGDITVPLSKLPAAINKVRDVRKRYGIPIIVLGHAGDGNLHPLIGFDPSNPEQKEKVEKAFNEICEVAISLGGAVSGEHGIGQKMVEMLRKELKAHGGDLTLELMRRIKNIFDPKGIMNPGKYGL